MDEIIEPFEFEWDQGNEEKSGIKHRVSTSEAEEAFFDLNRKVFEDLIHSKAEKRMVLIGVTEKQRLLYIIFMVRKNKIRIISARDINRKEVSLYEKAA